MKYKIIISILFFATGLISCSKSENTQTKKVQGNVSFYNIELSNCDTIHIECENQKGIVTKKYNSINAVCGLEGMYAVTLDTGIHKFIATCGSIKVEKEVYVKANECITKEVGFYFNPSLDGIWTLDLDLETNGSNCDETLIEDESHIPATLKFWSGNSLYFETDPVGSDLNGQYFTNKYDYNYPSLKISSIYNDGVDTIVFQANLNFDVSSNRFIGTYTNKLTDGTICNNNLRLYR